ncbi:MAG: ATP-binding protein [Pseudomonadota bacterium]
MYNRPILNKLIDRLHEPRKFIQALSGPRQSGKTTLARQAIDALSAPAHYASADEPALKGMHWIEQQWEAARFNMRRESSAEGILVLDEIQKMPGWSETVKRLWDEDTAEGCPLKVVILGSAPMLINQGLTESLAGRFEILYVTHWSYPEMRDAFGFDLERFIYYGGYPGAAPLASDRDRWARYILESLIETTISRDVLLLTRIDKPALLRQLFELGCTHSAQVLSYQKMLGQLQDAGNTTTLAHYLRLLDGAGMLAGLPKFSGSVVRRRASSPKLLALNTALFSAMQPLSFENLRRSPDAWGRLVETAVGAHLYNRSIGSSIALHYWIDRNRELDFVATRGSETIAIEVKTTAGKVRLPGIDAFAASFPVTRKHLIGPQGIPFEAFFAAPVESLF